MYCPRCGAALPDNARFCLTCGQSMVAATPPPPPPAAAPAAPTIASAGVQAMKCPQCGAPISPGLGEAVITCDYCGASVTLGGAGWKEISKHSMLLAQVVTPDQVMPIVRGFADQGFLHRHQFEESQVVDQKLQYVPFWVLPVSATTTYTYQDIAVSVGSTVGTIAAAEFIGGAMGGRRGPEFIAMPMVPPVNATRSDTIVGSYEFPVVAVRGMQSYQPKNYEFALQDRTLFNKSGIPGGVPVLNGDLAEDAAQFSAKAHVAQLQAEAARHKHSMVSAVNSQIEVGSGELMHVPVWAITLEHKGTRTVYLVDAHAAKIIQTIG